MHGSSGEKVQTLHAVHVCTGERALAARVEAWLAANGVVVQCVDNAFETCVLLSRKLGDPPNLVIVGLDWLSDDELALLSYIRDTWTNAVLVAYADDRSRQIILRDPMTCVCCEPAQLASLMSGTVADLLNRFQDKKSAPQYRPRPPSRHLSPPTAAAVVLPKVLDLPISRKSIEKSVEPSADNFEPTEPQSQLPASVVENPVIKPSELVSREELAALLNTYFR